MEIFSKQYGQFQMALISLKKAAVTYESQSEQTPHDTQTLIAIFTKTFDEFCSLITDYLALHHKNFSPGKNVRETLEYAHKAGFIAKHDLDSLLKATRDKNALHPSNESVESPLIHNIETYIETMQTIISEIKP